MASQDGWSLLRLPASNSHPKERGRPPPGQYPRTVPMMATTSLSGLDCGARSGFTGAGYRNGGRTGRK